MRARRGLKVKCQIAATGACLVAAAAAFADPSHRSGYEVRTDGLRFGEMIVETQTATASYGITVTAEAQGFFGFLLQSHYLGNASGTLSTEGRIIPHIFTAKTDRIFKHRDVWITFSHGTPASVDLTPEKDQTEFSIPNTVTDIRLDSLSYFYLMFTARPAACAPDGLLYDGRRLTRVGFSAPVVTVDSTTCNGVYVITNGPDHSLQSGQRSFDLTLIYPPAGGSPDSISVISGGHTVTLVRQ